MDCKQICRTSETNDKVLAKLNLTELVLEITDALAGTTPGKIPQKNLNIVRSAMKRYDASLNEWKPYEFWDSMKKYTRNLIATDYDNFTLMLLCWNPRKESPVHNHAGSECFVRIIRGTVCETKYEMPTSGCDALKVSGQCKATAGDVTFMNDSLGLHKIGNDTDEPVITLHCYLPPYQQCLCYLSETSRGVPCTATFYSEGGNRVDFSADASACPLAAKATNTTCDTTSSCSSSSTATATSCNNPTSTSKRVDNVSSAIAPSSSSSCASPASVVSKAVASATNTTKQHDANVNASAIIVSLSTMSVSKNNRN